MMVFETLTDEQVEELKQAQEIVTVRVLDSLYRK